MHGRPPGLRWAPSGGVYFGDSDNTDYGYESYMAIMTLLSRYSGKLHDIFAVYPPGLDQRTDLPDHLRPPPKYVVIVYGPDFLKYLESKNAMNQAQDILMSGWSRTLSHLHDG
jgi:hypothetical protein